jgi:hypothetical protein
MAAVGRPGVWVTAFCIREDIANPAVPAQDVSRSAAINAAARNAVRSSGAGDQGRNTR